MDEFTEAQLKKKKKEDLIDLLEERGLPSDGLKAQLINRLLGRKESAADEIEIDQHIINYGHGDIEKARLEHKRQKLNLLKTEELQAILRGRRQKISGTKGELIKRILGLEKTKLKRIDKSCVAKLLERDVREGNDVQMYDNSPLEADALYHTRVQYRRYPLDDFAALLETIRESHTTKKELAAKDDKEVLEQLEYLEGMAENTWRTHPGKESLREAINDGKHKRMKPRELKAHFKSTFDDHTLKQFRDRIDQEVLRTKQNNWNKLEEKEAEADSEEEDLSEWSDDDDSQSNAND